jgi:hypothetical protein
MHSDDVLIIVRIVNGITAVSGNLVWNIQVRRCSDFISGTHTLMIYVIARSNSEESEQAILCFEEAI